MRGQVVIKCPGCQTNERVSAKMPGFMSPVSKTYKCDVCESYVTALIERSKENHEAGAVRVTTKIMASPKLKSAVQEALEATE